MNPASHSDVSDRWRPLSDQEQTTAATLLDDAWRKVKRALPSIQERIDAGDDDLRQETVRVLADAVLRVLKNPDGARRDGVDNTTFDYDPFAAAGRLFIPPEDIAVLALPPLGWSGGAYVVSLGG